jgi:hypothetical protein
MNAINSRTKENYFTICPGPGGNCMLACIDDPAGVRDSIVGSGTLRSLWWRMDNPLFELGAYAGELVVIAKILDSVEKMRMALQ